MEKPEGEGEKMGKRILLADDNTDLVLICVDFLVIEGFVVTVARNGQEAIKCLQQQRFDLVITDYHMPIINGDAVAELCRKMKVEFIVTSNDKELKGRFKHFCYKLDGLGKLMEEVHSILDR